MEPSQCLSATDLRFTFPLCPHYALLSSRCSLNPFLVNFTILQEADVEGDEPVRDVPSPSTIKQESVLCSADVDVSLLPTAGDLNLRDQRDRDLRHGRRPCVSVR
jgi:hypothetical protein